MITLRNVSKSFGNQTLLESISLQINDGDRFALVGPNGAGKSTLFKLILGQETADQGTLDLRSGLRFGYLAQETNDLHGGSVVEEILEHDFSNNRLEAQAKKILAGLGFKETDFARKVTEFSGGWQMRVAIAKLLLQDPDLLMLDEPTNHLDLESLLWFQGYLQSFRGAIFLISHDREFINGIVDRIVEVREHKLNVYTGTFEDYLAQRKQEEENLISAYKRQQKEIEDLTDYINKFRAKASTASSVQSKIKYLDRMEKIVIPEELKTVEFSFPQPSRAGQNVLTLNNIRQSYDGKHWVYDGLDLTLERGQRIALVGPNGAGKSTLLKLLSGVLEFQEGERKLGYNVECGYFSQHRAEMFDPEKTVVQEAMNTQRNNTELSVRTVLGSFLFRGDTVFKKVGVLSGGEKSRLGLARLLLDPPNLLLLDEPTTHLDMASVEVLIQALKKYEGTICVISHDVYFIRQLANNVIHVNQGKVTWYPGDYDYFLHKKSQEEGEEGELFRSEERIEASHHAPPKPAPTPAKPSVSAPAAGEVKASGFKTKEQKRREAEERQARSRREQEEKRKEEVRKDLQEAEGLLLSELAKPETYQNAARTKDLQRRLGEIRSQLK